MSHYFIDETSGLQIAVERDGDDWVAEVRQLPGCAGQGSTLDESLEEVLVALDAVLEVLREDDPGRYAELLRQPVSSSAVRGTDATTTEKILLVAAPA